MPHIQHNQFRFTGQKNDNSQTIARSRAAHLANTPYALPGTVQRIVPLMIILLLAGCLVVPCMAQPTAKQGVLDLRNADLSQQNVDLTGEWKWYWHQLRLPNQPDSGFEYTHVPQLWGASRWHQQPLPSQGYATYSLTVLLPPRSRALTLTVPDHYCAYRLFVNGEELAHDGHPDTTAVTTIPYWSTQLINLPATDTLHLLLQIANFQHAKGGSAKAIQLGMAKRQEASLATDRGLDMLLTGCLLMNGLFFLGLFSFSRTDRSMLYFSLFCLAYSYRIIGADHYTLHALLPDLPWALTIRLEYISLYLAVGLGVVHTQTLYPEDTHLPVTRAMAWICFAFAATVLVLPTMLFTQLMNPFLALMVSYIGYASYVYWTAARLKRPGATYSLLGTALLMIVFGFIILQYFGLVTPHKFLLFLGYLGFFFLQSLVLSFRFAFALDAARQTEKQFLANMSHEIRTPLNAILGFSHLLETTPLNKEQQEFVRYVHTAGKNLLTIVNDILDIAKIEAGMLTLESIPFSLPSLVDSIRTMLQTSADEKHLQLVVNVDPTLPPVLLGDPTRLTQILLNLLSNAIKFTKEGSVTVAIEKRQETAGTVRVHFTVTDTGIGMSPDVLTHIFQRFRQANDSTTRHFGGTGLGLSIVKSLTELQGGWVTVTSTPGQGSCFALEITYRVAPASISDDADGKTTTWGPTGQPLTILVVEDNPMNQKLALGVLNRLGHTALIVENGALALELLQKDDVDLVLMDIQMPIMDGYTTTHHIRTTLQSQVPIIAMTAHALASERDQCLRAGMNDFLPKPFQPHDLQQLIGKYVPGGSRVRDVITKPANVIEVPGSVSVFSMEPLLTAVDGDTHFALELLEMFLNQTPVHIDQIRQALETSNLARIGRVLHTQKVAIKLLGLAKAHKQLETLELLVAANVPMTDIRPLVIDYLQTLEAELPTIGLLQQAYSANSGHPESIK